MIAILWGLVALGAEDIVMPADLPAYGQDKPMPVPEISQRELKNGLTVWVVPRPGPPKVSAVLTVLGGLASDSKEQQGTASLLAGLLDAGTTTRSAQQLAEEMQSLGGALRTQANADAITVFADAFVSKMPELVEVLADVTRNASFPDAEVALAKTNALQELQASEANPGFLSSRAFSAALYGDHPYARITPTAASLEAVTAQGLRQSHAQRFRPERALLVVVGPVSAGKVFRQVEKALGSWKGQGTALPELPLVPDGGWPEGGGSPKLVVVEREGSVQSSLRVGSVGVPATSPDAIPLALANTVLGGGFSSRITQNIREDKGYTYSPGAVVSRMRSGGSVVSQAEVRNDVTAATLNEIRYEFDRMGTTLVPEEELGRAKRYMAGLYLYSNQMQGNVAATLAGNWVVGLPPEYLGTYVTATQAVTAEQVREVARRYYPSRRQTLVVVGDREVIEAELSQYGEFETFQP